MEDTRDLSLTIIVKGTKLLTKRFSKRIRFAYCQYLMATYEITGLRFIFIHKTITIAQPSHHIIPLEQFISALEKNINASWTRSQGSGRRSLYFP
ncbi:hypothetical protein CEXT_46901 [Caerostris extrusa]|uniref:Uncharacterized protein n=1 Tax=Caerostris extrusa TaxID=172846 RepID=A0AAV4M7C2_CAEEX|nr:hypothetical protein CEXT_46901 [Caerostris extrusa]